MIEEAEMQFQLPSFQNKSSDFHFRLIPDHKPTYIAFSVAGMGEAPLQYLQRGRFFSKVAQEHLNVEWPFLLHQ